MFKHRLLTTIILLPIVIALIFFLSQIQFAIFIAIVAALLMREWLQLLGPQSQLEVILGSVLALLLCLLAYFISAIIILVLTVLIWLWAILAVVCYIVQQQQSLPLGLQHRWLKIIFGFCLFIGYWKAVLLLRQLSPQPWWLLFSILTIWAADCGAYFFGRLWGQNRRLLVPSVSPKKTWIGFWGGLLCGVIVATLFSAFLPLNELQRGLLILTSIIAIVFSILGDLFESMLKRQAGVKDSGGLLPGHGGFLDRLDSTLVALPVLALAFLLI